MAKTNLCSVHGIPLEQQQASALLGYPAPGVFDVDNMFPNHGLWSGLGGCLVEIDENGEIANETEEYIQVCNICAKDAQKYLDEHHI